MEEGVHPVISGFSSGLRSHSLRGGVCVWRQHASDFFEAATSRESKVPTSLAQRLTSNSLALDLQLVIHIGGSNYACSPGRTQNRWRILSPWGSEWARAQKTLLPGLAARRLHFFNPAWFKSSMVLAQLSLSKLVSRQLDLWLCLHPKMKGVAFAFTAAHSGC